jgi:hypothetical protein
MKTKTLSVRVEDVLVESLAKIEAGTNIERATIIRALLIAIDEFYRENGFIQMPFKVIPASTKATKRA